LLIPSLPKIHIHSVKVHQSSSRAQHDTRLEETRMNIGTSLENWWTRASRTTIGDLFATATVILFLLGVGGLILLSVSAVLHWTTHIFLR
jgi:hypothetical protein